jgi:hypothetical protein
MTNKAIKRVMINRETKRVTVRYESGDIKCYKKLPKTAISFMERGDVIADNNKYQNVTVYRRA